MLTIILKRVNEPTVVQMTQSDLVKQVSQINGTEIILTDSWAEGLKKVRTPYVSLIEDDCVFSANYYSSNFGLMKKAHAKVVNGKIGGGGYQKLAMISSCLGIKDFGNRIYNYELKKVKDGGEINGVQLKIWGIIPSRTKVSTKLYTVQVGFVPGAIIRYSAIKDIIDDELWETKDLVKLSTAVSFYLWNTNRSLQVNPNTTYVSGDDNLELPPLFDVKVPDKVANIFTQQYIGKIPS